MTLRCVILDWWKMKNRNWSSFTLVGSTHEWTLNKRGSARFEYWTNTVFFSINNKSFKYEEMSHLNNGFVCDIKGSRWVSSTPVYRPGTVTLYSLSLHTVKTRLFLYTVNYFMSVVLFDPSVHKVYCHRKSDLGTCWGVEVKRLVSSLFDNPIVWP